MNASRLARAGGALGHLLLVVVLALGVFVMHTVGHPEEHSGAATSSHSAVDVPGAGMAAMAAAHERPSHTTDSSPTTEQPAMSMDMASVCVAVFLGLWMLASLVRAALTRDVARTVALLARTPVGRHTDPPPRGPDLTQLSVLRT
ncbi:DUF6153 family protein [Streptomyces spongiae]|uniref:Uncharacterized protein n=1 Tax=Streptomyces spongiae TaxID=565072 RepID=A0A5N8XNW0_9ACTN|nr:DUF6153 family protein [Streptomyces spongiae]MPY61041.1 hypothetical protein [Streptomyces spongiae]